MACSFAVSNPEGGIHQNKQSESVWSGTDGSSVCLLKAEEPYKEFSVAC